jgi:hypothetical protein
LAQPRILNPFLNPLSPRKSAFHFFVYVLKFHLTKRNLEPLIV